MYIYVYKLINLYVECNFVWCIVYDENCLFEDLFMYLYVIDGMIIVVVINSMILVVYIIFFR